MVSSFAARLVVPVDRIPCMSSLFSTTDQFGPRRQRTQTLAEDTTILPHILPVPIPARLHVETFIHRQFTIQFTYEEIVPTEQHPYLVPVRRTYMYNMYIQTTARIKASRKCVWNVNSKWKVREMWFTTSLLMFII